VSPVFFGGGQDLFCKHAEKNSNLAGGGAGETEGIPSECIYIRVPVHGGVPQEHKCPKDL